MGEFGKEAIPPGVVVEGPVHPERNGQS